MNPPDQHHPSLQRLVPESRPMWQNVLQPFLIHVYTYHTHTRISLKNVRRWTRGSTVQGQLGKRGCRGTRGRHPQGSRGPLRGVLGTAASGGQGNRQDLGRGMRELGVKQYAGSPSARLRIKPARSPLPVIPQLTWPD